MSTKVQNLKITGWEYKGFKTPDVIVNIDDKNNTRDFTLYQMLSGEGKLQPSIFLETLFMILIKKITLQKSKDI